MYQPHICSLQAAYHAIGWPCSCIHIEDMAYGHRLPLEDEIVSSNLLAT
jgi:hypothetical protein